MIESTLVLSSVWGPGNWAARGPGPHHQSFQRFTFLPSPIFHFVAFLRIGLECIMLRQVWEALRPKGQFWMVWFLKYLSRRILVQRLSLVMKFHPSLVRRARFSQEHWLISSYKLIQCSWSCSRTNQSVRAPSKWRMLFPCLNKTLNVGNSEDGK